MAIAGWFFAWCFFLLWCYERGRLAAADALLDEQQALAYQQLKSDTTAAAPTVPRVRLFSQKSDGAWRN